MLMRIMAKLEKYLFPGFLFFFEVIFLVLFGLLVKYDEAGAPDAEREAAERFRERNGGDPEGFIRELESTLSTTKVYPFFQDVHVMVFIGFGFLMTFLRRYGYSSIAFNMLVAAFAIQWSTITNGVFTFIEQVSCCTISVNLETMVASDFAAAAALITMGAVLGRASPFQLIIITFFELMLYSANEAINIHVYHAADIGGSMLIHTFGAYFGVAVSFVMYREKAKDHSRNSTVYHSDLFSMIGTLFLWLFWPSFNGALASGNGQYRAIINTYYSLTGSVLATVIFSMLVNKGKIGMSHIQNATLAGGVAVGSVANMVIQPWAAILIGFLSGAVSVIGYQYISPLMEKKLRMQDTCGVHNLHGLPGIFSGVASAIAAGVAEEVAASGKAAYGSSLFVVFPARAPSNATELANNVNAAILGVEPGADRSAGTQAGFQLALLVTTLAISILGGLVTGVIVNYIPAFNSIETKGFFDDDLYWELADDADNYLPEGTPSDEAEAPPVSITRYDVSSAAQPPTNEVRQRKLGSPTMSDEIKVEEHVSTV